MIDCKLPLFLTISILLPATVQGRNAAPWVGQTLDGKPCTGGGQGYGPWDYTKPEERSQIPIVEVSHFSSDVENHIKGIGGHIPGDLDYVLRAVPNHHKALLSTIRYQIKWDKKLIYGEYIYPLSTPVECYLQRAIHFSPKDAASISLYAYYLKEAGQLNKAADYYAKALAIDEDNAKIAYSYSLLLIELNRYEEALKYAKIAYQNKEAPPGLKKKLEKIVVWPK